MREGIIKINPYRFQPVVSYETGRTLWTGFKRDIPIPHKESCDVCPEQINWAYEHVNETVSFHLIDGYVKIIKPINEKNKKKKR